MSGPSLTTPKAEAAALLEPKLPQRPSDHSLILKLYQGATRLAKPVVWVLLRRRAMRGKEDPTRRGERMGHAGLPRPDGPLVWMHAASVGESLTTLPLIARLSAERPDLYFLVTTGTVTAARLMANRLPERGVHQFVPVDLPDAVERFIDHWRPDLSLWFESELWPNLIDEAAARHKPMAMVNARMSADSAKGWSRAKGAIRALLDPFDPVLCQTEETAERLRDLGAARAVSTGNLKEAAPPPPADPAELARLREEIGDRPVFVAASTHPGEEDAAGAAWSRLRQLLPGLLTIIAPRHPERGEAIVRELGSFGARVGRRSAGDRPGRDCDIYVADTLGELGLWYRLAPVAFIGGSLEPVGGHNPYEPAPLGAAILHGPHIGNFAEEYARLTALGATRRVINVDTLTDAVAALLAPDGGPTEEGARLIEAAGAFATEGEAIVERVMAALRPVLPPPAGT